MSSSYSRQMYGENQQSYFHAYRKKISTLIIAKKTLLFDLLSVQKLIASVLFMVLIPMIILGFIKVTPGASFLEEGGPITFALYFYTFGLVFPIIIIASAGPLISQEIDSGTMLILVSKPIDRTRIMLGKFIALFLFGLIISFCSLLIICIQASMFFPGSDISMLFGINFLYSIAILFFFGVFTLGLSATFRKPKNVMLLPLLIVIFTFLIMFIFRPMLVGSGVFEDAQLYHFDIGYHLGNIYLGIIETFYPTVWEYDMFVALFMYFGLGKYIITEGYHYDLTRAQYYPAPISFLAIASLAIILLVIGIYIFYKREISG